MLFYDLSQDDNENPDSRSLEEVSNLDASSESDNEQEQVSHPLLLLKVISFILLDILS